MWASETVGPITAREDIAFLVGSASRVSVLEQLHRTLQRPIELAETCPCTRETVQRALSDFVDRGWVEKRSHRYHLTFDGGLMLSRYRDLVEASENAERLAPCVANIDSSLAELSHQLLRRATVTTGTAENPHAPIDRYLTVLGSDPVETYYGISPVVSRVFNGAAEVIGPETEMELVVDASMLEASPEIDPEAFERANELDQFTLYLSPSPVEMGLAVFDGYAWLGAYDRGNLIACIDGDGDRTDDFSGADTRITQRDPAPASVIGSITFYYF
ncbi:helix-turn-helix transcriptional regulator [Haloprofundus halobius]|uniref:helix-turn-helix transcriptional regulator n=1 Tax=Haloprofundus halobius TaxID=2876194 RepID=UPI001CCC471D|nr:hypothetical protein [Haloprofundus halobius]